MLIQSTLRQFIDEKPYIQGDRTPIKTVKFEENYANLSQEEKDCYDWFTETFQKVKTPITRTVVDGEVLPIGGRIEIIHTPGHTPGHMCLYLQTSKTLVTGDGLNADNGKLTGSNPVYTYDMALAMESSKKLQTFEIETVVTYHGGIVTGDIRKRLENLLCQ